MAVFAIGFLSQTLSIGGKKIS